MAISPEERLQIEQAKLEKARQIKEFSDIKTDQIIKTSAFNGAVDLISAGMGKEVLPKIKELADELEEELRTRIKGVPF